MSDFTVLAVSGSLREGSTNSALVRTAADLSVPGIVVTEFQGMGDLPHFNPDDDVEPLPPAVERLRTAIAKADAVLFCTPEYAGALPGSFKNLLDWSVGATDGIYEKPVAWVNASASPTGAANAHASLRIVLGYVNARIIEEACVPIPVPRAAVEPGAKPINDESIRRRVGEALVALRSGSLG
ncbi:MAG: NADPH-dependent reductase [Acidimicrobiia bacterium]|nr:NADPH-dependent reductase [Acidimicrobiia bacterium]